MFFIEESRAANQLRQLGSIDTNKGSVTINVRPCPPPRGLDDDDRNVRASSWNPRGGQAGRYGRGSSNRGGIIRRTDRAEGDITMEEDPSTALLVNIWGERYSCFWGVDCWCS